MKTIIASIFGVLAVITFILSIQCKNKKEILKLQLISNVLYAIQYFLLSVFTASMMNIISSIRCFVFASYKNKIPKAFLYLFVGAIVILGIITYQNPLSLIPILITLTYIISSYQKDTKYLRIMFLICSFIWFYYNYKVGAYICLIGNVFETISGTISIIRYERKKSISTL